MIRSFCIVLLLIATLSAKDIKQINLDASALIKQKNYTKAYVLLHGVHVLNATNNQSLYLLGLSAHQLGKIDEAIFFYEKLLKDDPQAHRVRLDLAKCYYEKNDLAKTKELLILVQSSNPPQNVQDNIDQFLHQINQKQEQKFAALFNVGYVYDSNANVGPQDENDPLLRGAIFDKATSDTVFKYGVNMHHTYKNDVLLWRNSFGVNVNDYQGLDSLDSMSGYFSSALLFKDNSLSYVVPLVLNAMKIGHEDRYYSRYIALMPKLSYQYSKKSSVDLKLLLREKNYYKNSNRKMNSLGLSPSHRYLLDQSSYVDLGFDYLRENSKIQSYSNVQKGVNVRYFKAFTKSLNASIHTAYLRTDYESDLNRFDRQYTAYANLSYALAKFNTYAVLSVLSIKNRSNLAIFDYERIQTGLNLTYKF
ncbi:MAG: tetratricopeptide repeat protein [Campylobacterota bacterium]|nr:tetratricopeptide repeat protein [Campylobacterota bacterium]